VTSPRNPSRGRTRSATPTRRIVITSLALLTLASLAIPRVRTELHQSFTRLPSTYTELFFAETPTATAVNRRRVITVPAAVLHHGSAAQRFTVRMTISDPAGAAIAMSEQSVNAVPDKVVAASFATRLPRGRTGTRAGRPAGSYLITVALPGHPQTLHFRLDTQDAA
jgi:hypothetical protein